MVELTKKISGSTILEPLVAIVIISSVITISTLVFGNIASSNDGFIKFKATNKINELMQKPDLTIDEDFTFHEFVIEKYIQNYKGLNDVIQVCWIVKGKNENKTILEKCYLLNE